MNVLSLYSGIGGMDLGLERAGFNIVAQCEIDEKCRDKLNRHWPRVPIYTDVRTLTAEQLKNDGLREIQLVCGGFPCTPYSRANYKRKGREDGRDCAGETIRLVSEFEPTVFLGENTEGFIDVGLLPFLDDLEEIGYKPQALSIPSAAVGLPTLERHVWIVATRRKKYTKRICQNTISRLTGIQGEFSRSCEREPGRWDISTSRVLRGGKGISEQMDRVGQLGNSVDPVIVELLGRSILEA